ncbi:MAG: DUF5050 domain-containing protein [Clostridiales bacterium]|jgi:hypothetical protein|nr:DUF5050 domain-containing protein [Clostridiales bacterium]
MKKKLGKIITALVLTAVLMFALTACEDPIKGGQADGNVYGNGSLVVTQGDYIYFVNGMTTKDANNKSGEVVKGAIMRAKIDANGNIDDGGIVTIVPQAYFTSYTGGGLYIFGEWIYYVTPNPEKDKTGASLSGQTLVMRTKIDGTKTKRIAVIKAEGVQYTVNKNYFIYLDGTDLKAIDLNKNNFKTSTIETGVTSVKFPTAPYYSKSGYPPIFDYAVYTKNSSEKVTGQTHNEVKAVNGGGDKITLIGDKAYFNGDGYLENLDDLYTYTLSTAVLDDAGNLTVYLSRSGFAVSGSKDNGVFAYTFTSGNGYAIDKDNVVWLSGSQKTTFKPAGTAAADGIFVVENGALFFYEGKNERILLGVIGAGKTYADKDAAAKSLNEQALKVYNGELNLLRVTKYGSEGNLYEIYFTPSTSNGALKRVIVSTDGTRAGTYAEDYKDFAPYDNVRVVIASDFVSNWIAPSFINYDGGRLYCYFIYAYNYNYLYRIDLSAATADGRDYLADNSDLIKIVGKFNAADRASYDEREKEETE